MDLSGGPNHDGQRNPAKHVGLTFDSQHRCEGRRCEHEQRGGRDGGDHLHRERRVHPDPVTGCLLLDERGAKPECEHQVDELEQDQRRCDGAEIVGTENSDEHQRRDEDHQTTAPKAAERPEERPNSVASESARRRRLAVRLARRQWRAVSRVRAAHTTNSGLQLASNVVTRRWWCAMLRASMIPRPWDPRAARRSHGSADI